MDWKVLSGQLPGWKPGHTPGVDAAGVVVAAGEEASIAVGTRVAYHCDLQRPGSFAAHTVVD
ncbi:alcohol dehydrogenase catalytic domain-containing protein [Edaphobacter paludis]|uniref:Alcohol dehydrogenase-like N-terminal domain-containing protein n=1 Tax=Edaphobacter paludis TaxID=3035702 RepID=A0AAU7CVW5_9BACT